MKNKQEECKQNCKCCCHCCSNCKQQEKTQDWERNYTFELDNVIEDMNGYVGKKLYEDELFDRLNSWGKSFIAKEKAKSYLEGMNDKKNLIMKELAKEYLKLSRKELQIK